MALAQPLTFPAFQYFTRTFNTDGSIAGLVPACGYIVRFYDAGTTNPKTVYTDPDLTIPYSSPSNAVTLNTYGYAVIYPGAGAYKLTIESPTGSVEFYQDYLESNGSFGTGFVDTIADLALADTNTNQFIYVAGYFAINDGGEGFFYNKTSVASPDGGYTIASTFDPSKRWFRISSGDVYAAYFGYIPGTAGDQTSRLQVADAYSSTLWSTRLVIQAGNSATITTLTLNSPVVVFETGAQLNASSEQTVTFNGLIDAYGSKTNNSIGSGIFPIFGTNITAVLSSSQIGAIAEWWGATIANPDNQPYFDKLWASGAASFQINPGTWLVSSSTPPATKLIISYGILTTGSVVIIPIGTCYLVGIIKCSTSIHANGIISTPAQVKAYQVQPSLGFSNTRFNASGRILSITGNATTSGTSLKTLLSRTLLASSLQVAGDSLRITASGFILGSGSVNRTIAIKYGSGPTSLFSLAGSLNTGLSTAGYKIILDFVMTGPNTANWFGQIVAAGISAGQDIGSAGSGSFDPTINQAIFVSAICDSGSITNTQLLIEYFGV